MQYPNVWKKVLGSDEKVLFEFNIAKKYRVFKVVLYSIVGLILMLASIKLGLFIVFLSVFYFAYLKEANAFAFTEKRILVHRGWLSTKLVSIDYKKITDVTVDEPFLDRIVTQTGSIAINTAGSIGNEVVLKHIAKPYEVKKKLDELRNEH